MAGVSLSHVYKVYPNGTKAVNDLNLDINDKEFIVFVGSLGCGKSTSLRMIAGLEEITAGVIRIGGEVVNDLGPSDRDTAMVFQNYSLYPHLTVYQNIAFPLRMMKLPKAEIQEKVLSAAKILGLESLLDQKPDTLSGGQKQRVALGRAIVREPKVFLLDEPLSNLDAKLRPQMRAEITKLHKRLKTTFIYVTHDQVEAMTMGDRIVVMKDGYVQQIDTPTNLYRYPANKFVAGFIGSPPMNFYDAKVFVQGEGAEVEFANGQKMKINPREIIKLEKDYRSGKPLILGIRPEDIRIAEEESNRSVLCRIMQKEILGSETLLYADFDTEAIDYENSSSGVIIKVPGVPEAEAGAVVPIEFDFSKAQFFDAESEECVSKRFPEKDRIEVFIKDKTLYFGNAEIGLPQALGNLEGAYEMVFPITAIRKGNAFRAEVVYSEKAEGTCLAWLVSGNQAFWAALPEEAGGNVSLDFAYEKLAFYRDGSGQAPVPEWNILSGTLLKKKRKDKNEFGLKFDVVFAGEGAVLCSVVFNGLLAYSFAVIKPSGYKFFYALVLFSYMIPAFSSIVPLYKSIVDLKLMNSYVPLWLMFGANAFYLMMMKNYFESIPKSIFEAAAIDKCSPFKTFFLIVLPLSKPILSVVAIFTMTAAWSDFLLPYLVLNDSDMMTIMVKIYDLKTTMGNVQGFGPDKLLMVLTISILPQILIFILFQKRITANAYMGAIKE